MAGRLLPITLALFGLIFSSRADNPSIASVRNRAEQMVVVRTKDWDTLHGTLSLFEKRTGAWVQTDSWPVVVGRKGLAWGSGITQPPNSSLIKKEGDGKSPAGVFTISSAFGLEPANAVKGLKLPYLPLSSVVECIDDARSPHYNQIVDRATIRQPDWTSSERMAEYKETYRLGAVVDHNRNPIKQGGGSCIFLHIWKNDRTGTAGCTAMKGDHMEQLLKWLDPARNPLLVQLPDAEYLRLTPEWKLPTAK